MTHLPTPLTCPDCDEEIWGETEEDRAAYYEAHLGTVGHKIGELGEAGRGLRDVLAGYRDAALYRMGLIPKPPGSTHTEGM